jgi:wyosine [tRNA(Phe)-imidazoG37] synthetase (radical SAM superfamily)
MFYTPYGKIVDARLRNIISDCDYPLDDEPGSVLASLQPGPVDEAVIRKQLAADMPRLFQEKWFFESAAELWRAYRLRYVSLETTTVCNQRCFFCPVSHAPRDASEMSDSLLGHVLSLMTAIPTIEGVFLNNYNEPFVDKRTASIIAELNNLNLKVAINTNGSIFPRDLALKRNSIELLTVNLHTVNRDKYMKERGRDHLRQVLGNINMFVEAGVAAKMRIAVLGDFSPAHEAEFLNVKQAFESSQIDVQMFRLMDRAGNLLGANFQPVDNEIVWGCEQTGSRPLEHLHVLPDGRCVLCCEDYYEQHVVGDLNVQTIDEVMAGDAMAAHREIIFGFRKMPEHHLCRKCEFAIRGSHLRSMVA